jgi:hypothetical protein
MEMVEQAVAHDQGVGRGKAWGLPLQHARGQGQAGPREAQPRPEGRRERKTTLSQLQHRGGAVDSQHRRPRQGRRQTKADVARPAPQVEDPPVRRRESRALRVVRRGKGEPGGVVGREQGQDPVGEGLVGAGEIRLRAGPSLRGIVHQFRFADALHAWGAWKITIYTNIPSLVKARGPWAARKERGKATAHIRRQKRTGWEFFSRDHSRISLWLDQRFTSFLAALTLPLARLSGLVHEQGRALKDSPLESAAKDLMSSSAKRRSAASATGSPREAGRADGVRVQWKV